MPLRLLATVLAIVASIAAAPRGQERGPSVQIGPRRVPVQTSDVLTHSPLEPCGETSQTAPSRLRVVTWNIHAARSAPVNAIAEELQAMQADVIALQEVDVRTRRSGFIDQAAALATTLRVQHVFAASIKWDEGDYGLAVLSRWPLVQVQRHRLRILNRAEPRIVLEVTACVAGRPLRLFNHHADARLESRVAGLSTLRTIAGPHVGNGILVVGDFNEAADGAGVRTLIDGGLVDLSAAGRRGASDGRIDYMFSDTSLARAVVAWREWPTTKSDHDALVIEVAWPPDRLRGRVRVFD